MSGGSKELAPWPPELTRRERQIAELICAGKRRREIVAALEIAPTTFDSHRYAIMAALGVANEVQLVRKALAHGWVRGDAPPK